MDEYSFEKIDYSVRPAKCVERRLIGQTLSQIGAAFPIGQYRYIGFGSLWFVDFVLFHRWLQIRSMYSIEKAAEKGGMPRRFSFNKPLKCIKIVPGLANERLPSVLKTRQRSILWLDYDGNLESALSGDLSVALPKMRDGNVLLISVNAHSHQLKSKKKPNDEPMTEIEYLDSIAPDLVPGDANERVTKKRFPALAAEILTAAIQSKTLELALPLSYVPIWSFTYRDGAPMATVGGMFLSAESKQKLDALDLFGRFDFLSANGVPTEIALPIITLREKLYLDSLMPSETPALTSLKFEMEQESLDAFVRFYNYIPTFGELAW